MTNEKKNQIHFDWENVGLRWLLDLRWKNGHKHILVHFDNFQYLTASIFPYDRMI